MKFLNKSHRNSTASKSSNDIAALTQQAVASAEEARPQVVANMLNTPTNRVFCTVRDPWTWVMQEILQMQAKKEQEAQLTIVDSYPELPSGKLNSSVSSSNVTTDDSSSRMSRGGRRKGKSFMAPAMSTLRIDIVSNQNNDLSLSSNTNGRQWTLASFHGTSEAFDGLEDKDEFVRTLKRCRCEHLELSPPSVLINWDVSQKECMNLVGDSMPTLLGNEGKNVAVLKEPMGKSGAGVFFVHDAQEIHEIIEVNRKQAQEESGFLDDLISQKGRIPSWGKLLCPC
jgi:hypothetical protein